MNHTMNDDEHAPAMPIFRPRGRPSLPEIRIQRARCPECASPRLKKYRSLADRGDGAAMSWMQCRACAHRFRVVEE